MCIRDRWKVVALIGKGIELNSCWLPYQERYGRRQYDCYTQQTLDPSFLYKGRKQSWSFWMILFQMIRFRHIMNRYFLYFGLFFVPFLHFHISKRSCFLFGTDYSDEAESVMPSTRFAVPCFLFVNVAGGFSKSLSHPVLHTHGRKSKIMMGGIEYDSRAS